MTNSFKKEGIEFLEVNYKDKGLYHEINFKVRENGKLSEEKTETLYNAQGGKSYFYYDRKQIFI